MRFPNIQLLRLAAAAGVALFHLGHYAQTVADVDLPALRNPWLAGFPVPLFFAVSGFVLAGAARSATPGRFLLARFLRLYPGYWLAVLLTIGLMRAGVFTDMHAAFARFVSWATFTLRPVGPGRVVYTLGIEWSLIYEVLLSVAVGLFSLAGPRRGLPILTGAWLAVIVGRMAVRPELVQAQPLTPWPDILLSAYNVPFLVGVLAYQVREAGRKFWPLVLAAVLGLLAAGPGYPVRPEVGWSLWGVAAAGLVWLAAGTRQVAARNRLVRLGDCTYGLFLVHVPLMLLVLYPAVRQGWAGRPEVVVVAGLTAIVGGLLFGRLEAALHARLRPLAAVPHTLFLRRAAGRLGWPFRPTPATAPPRRALP